MKMQLSAQALLYLIAWVAGMVFSAGGAWVKLRQVRRDVNGLGAKLRLLQGLLIRWAREDPQKVDQIARIIEGK
jgi:hypothetical protein